MVSFFPIELEIQKKSSHNNPLVYRGNLETTSENENQIFYRCQLKLVGNKKSGVGAVVVIFLIIGFVGIMAWAASKSR